jgi:hypothetical protein
MATAKSNFKAAVKRAKGLYRTGRYKTFADAVKAAYKKAGPSRTKKSKRKVGATKWIEKGETRRTPARRIVKVRRTKSGSYKNFQTIGSLKSKLRGKLKQQLSTALVTREMSKTKRAKRKAQARVSKIKGDIKKLS